MAAPSSGERLQKLYAMLERLRSAEMRAAAGAVAETERQQAVERDTWHQAAGHAREALAAGMPETWAAAEATRVMALLCAARLVEDRQARAGELVLAETLYRASRVQAEQMRRMVEAAEQSARTLEERRDQGHADDRFLARRGWLQMHARTLDDDAA